MTKRPVGRPAKKKSGGRPVDSSETLARRILVAEAFAAAPPGERLQRAADSVGVSTKTAERILTEIRKDAPAPDAVILAAIQARVDLSRSAVQAEHGLDDASLNEIVNDMRAKLTPREADAAAIRRALWRQHAAVIAAHDAARANGVGKVASLNRAAELLLDQHGGVPPGATPAKANEIRLRMRAEAKRLIEGERTTRVRSFSSLKSVS